MGIPVIAFFGIVAIGFVLALIGSIGTVSLIMQNAQDMPRYIVRTATIAVWGFGLFSIPIFAWMAIDGAKFLLKVTKDFW